MKEDFPEPKYGYFAFFNEENACLGGIRKIDELALNPARKLILLATFAGAMELDRRGPHIESPHGLPGNLDQIW